jgi:hypothetical protein
MTVVRTSAIVGGRIRWARVLGLAFALEAVLFAVLLPLQPVLSLRVWFVAVAAGCFVFAYTAGWLAARGLSARAVLHGTLVGIIATAIYLVINLLAPGGLAAAAAFYGVPLFVAVNALRILGCAAGAFHQTRA